MITPISEICDRFSIVSLKLERGRNDESSVLAEYKVLEKEIARYRRRHVFKDQWIQELYVVNGRIWDLESDIRSGKEKLLGLAEVGRRAIAIRELNKKRIAIKNRITKETQIGFKEVKINHASA